MSLRAALTARAYASLDVAIATATPFMRQHFHPGWRVCRALHRGDRDSLLALCIRDDEFRDILWREFPQSRPVVGLEWTDAWTIVGPC